MSTKFFANPTTFNDGYFLTSFGVTNGAQRGDIITTWVLPASRFLYLDMTSYRSMLFYSVSCCHIEVFHYFGDVAHENNLTTAAAK